MRSCHGILGRATTYLMLVAALSTGLAGCMGVCMFFQNLPHTGRPLPTIDGPEAPTLLEGMTGTLIAVDREQPDQVEVVSIPDLSRRIVHVDGKPDEVSGPDIEGRIAYLERDEWKGLHRRPTYLVKIMSLVTSKETLLFERSGDLTLGTSIALAPRGGHLALLRCLELGGFRHTPLVLEIIDLADGQSTQIEGSIGGSRPIWFPDGVRLAFAVTASDPAGTDVVVLDLASGDRRTLCRGAPRAISPDGHALWVRQSYEDGLACVDAITGEILLRNPSLPSPVHGSLVADLGEDKVLAPANPTTGSEQAIVSGWNHGAKWTVKLFDVRSGAFVTVLPHVWGPVAYGPFVESPKVAGK